MTAAELPKLSRKRLTEYLTFSNRFCAISVQCHGALDSYPTLEQMETEFPCSKSNLQHILYFSAFICYIV